MSATLTINLDVEVLQLAEREARARHTTLPEIFLDTDVALDHLADRQPFAE